jgi:predicted amidophosphoribosyltransferase
MRYCPTCREEFQDWATLCTDCKVPLVDKLPKADDPKPEQNNKSNK